MSSIDPMSISTDKGKAITMHRIGDKINRGVKVGEPNLLAKEFNLHGTARANRKVAMRPEANRVDVVKDLHNNRNKAQARANKDKLLKLPCHRLQCHGRGTCPWVKQCP
jgi:methyl coenzyme M reductase gamma subunit